VNIPEELKYTKEHTWLKIEGNLIVLGITDYAQDLLGEINCVDLPEKGEVINKDEAIATIESQKSVFDVLSPLKGEIFDLNNKLTQKPNLINSNPYEDGWLVKLKISGDIALKDILTHTEYNNLISGAT